MSAFYQAPRPRYQPQHNLATDYVTTNNVALMDSVNRFRLNCAMIVQVVLRTFVTMSALIPMQAMAVVQRRNANLQILCPYAAIMSAFKSLQLLRQRRLCRVPCLARKGRVASITNANHNKCVALDLIVFLEYANLLLLLALKVAMAERVATTQVVVPFFRRA